MTNTYQDVRLDGSETDSGGFARAICSAHRVMAGLQSAMSRQSRFEGCGTSSQTYPICRSHHFRLAGVFSSNSKSKLRGILGIGAPARSTFEPSDWPRTVANGRTNASSAAVTACRSLLRAVACRAQNAAERNGGVGMGLFPAGQQQGTVR